LSKITLKVMPLSIDSSPIKKARISSDIFSRLFQNENTGFLFVRKNDKATVLIAEPSKDDNNKNYIRLDVTTRILLGVRVGEEIEVEEARAVPAEEILLVPTEKLGIASRILVNVYRKMISSGIPPRLIDLLFKSLNGDRLIEETHYLLIEEIKKTLYKKPILKGEEILVYSKLVDDTLRFRVEETIPEKIVFIDKDTVINIGTVRKT